MTRFVREFVAVQDQALPSDFCHQLVTAFDASDKQVPGRTGHGVDPAKKLSVDITLDQHPEWTERRDAFLRHLQPLVEAYFRDHHFALIGGLSPSIGKPGEPGAVTLNAENWETHGMPRAGSLVWRLFQVGPVNLQRYPRDTGGYPHWLSEVFPQPESNEALRRIVFVMFYLNDVEEGGETEFYYQQLSIVPRTGRAVVAPAGFTHTHRGRAALSGDKYIATTWILFRPAETLYRAPGASSAAEPSHSKAQGS